MGCVSEGKWGLQVGALICKQDRRKRCGTRSNPKQQCSSQTDRETAPGIRGDIVNTHHAATSVFVSLHHWLKNVSWVGDQTHWLNLKCKRKSGFSSGRVEGLSFDIYHHHTLEESLTALLKLIDIRDQFSNYIFFPVKTFNHSEVQTSLWKLCKSLLSNGIAVILCMLIRINVSS